MYPVHTDNIIIISIWFETGILLPHSQKELEKKTPYTPQKEKRRQQVAYFMKDSHMWIEDWKTRNFFNLRQQSIIPAI